MNPPNKKTLIVVGLFVVGFMVMGLATSLLSDFTKLKEVFAKVEFFPLALALLSTGMAYLSSALSFNALFKLTPFRIPFLKFFSIMFISDTVNFIISSAGMSSIANRALLLKHEKVPYAVTVPLSLAQNMIFNLVLSCVCCLGLVYLRGHPEFVGGPQQAVLLAFMVGLLFFVGGMIVFFFVNPTRRWLLNQILVWLHWIENKFWIGKINPQKWVGFFGQLESTVGFLHKGWFQLIMVFFWVLMNWGFMAAAFYFCFHAVGLHLSAGLLLVGFMVMFLSSNINPVPSGLGVSESILAITFKYLGQGFEPTLVAAILFRLVYYLIPLTLSTALFLETLRTFLKSSVAERTL